jgi:hypothetical protein
MLKCNTKKAVMLQSGSKQNTTLRSFFVTLPSLKKKREEDKRVAESLVRILFVQVIFSLSMYVAYAPIAGSYPSGEGE